MTDNVSISSPHKCHKMTKQKEPDPATSSMRLYRAPQSTIRSNETNNGSMDDHHRDKSASNARRRRLQAHGPNSAAMVAASKSPSIRSLNSPAVGVMSSRATVGHSSARRRSASRFHLQPQHLNSSDDDSSCSSIFESLEAPCLWIDDVEGHKSANLVSNCWSPSGHSGRKSKYRQRHSLPLGSADSVKSEHRRSKNTHSSNNNNGDEESVCTHYTTRSMCEVSMSHAALPARDDPAEKGSRMALYQRRWVRFWHQQGKNGIFGGGTHAIRRWKGLSSLLQILFVLAFIIVVCDSRRRVNRHNYELQQYDEERAHILEQMTWIDNAAKKVHKKYAGYEQYANNNLLLKTIKPDPNDFLLRDEYNILRTQMDQMQVRVQQNARDRTVRHFGDKPVQVSLPVSDSGTAGEHVVIALSDDAPHAVSTFLQQVSGGLWDDVDFQRFKNGRVLQAATRFTSTTPVLEFVEKSRGCRQAGSVAVHQLESDDFHVLVLKIHMEETATIDNGDVCIGTVVRGLETLEQIIPHIPIIGGDGS